jgi:hypothetical protein
VMCYLHSTVAGMYPVSQWQMADYPCTTWLFYRDLAPLHICKQLSILQI